MKIEIPGVGQVQVDECDIDIVMSGLCELKNGYVYFTTGKYKGQYLHIIIGERMGLLDED